MKKLIYSQFKRLTFLLTANICLPLLATPFETTENLECECNCEMAHEIDASAVAGGCRGKIDIAPAFVHVDILESGHTVKRMDMWAVRADFSYLIWKGLFVKPTLLYANGGAAKGGLLTTGIGLGIYIPITKSIAISPLAGITYSHLWTKIDLPPYALENLRERFKSWSPYVGAEIAWNFKTGWRIYGSVQYAWSRTKTTIEKIVSMKSNSKGPTYALMLEKDLSDQWSINIGAAYNIGLSKEKHGLRATGVKAGISYWF